MVATKNHFFLQENLTVIERTFPNLELLVSVNCQSYESYPAAVGFGKPFLCQCM